MQCPGPTTPYSLVCITQNKPEEICYFDNDDDNNTVVDGEALFRDLTRNIIVHVYITSAD